MEDRKQGLADELADLGRFASAWLMSRHPKPLAGWNLEAVPGYLAQEVRDEADRPVLCHGVEVVSRGRASVFQMPPPDSSGVSLGSPHQWADILPMNSKPGGTYPGATDLLAVRLSPPKVGIVFTMGPPTVNDVQSWMAPGRFGRGRATGSTLGTSQGVPLSYPNPGRARAHQAVHGGRRWDAITVAGRGYPQLRVLQVAIHEQWISDGDAYPVLKHELLRLHFWSSKTDHRHFRNAEDIDKIVDSAALLLIDQAVRGTHVPAYPMGRAYLRKTVLKVMASISADWGTTYDVESRAAGDIEDSDDADDPIDRVTVATQPSAQGGSERNRRRVELALARGDGVPSLMLLADVERAQVRERADQILARRARLRKIRAAVRDNLVEAGVTISSEAIRQFVARYSADSEEAFQAAGRCRQRPPPAPAQIADRRLDHALAVAAP